MAKVPYSDKIAQNLEAGEVVLWSQHSDAPPPRGGRRLSTRQRRIAGGVLRNLPLAVLIFLIWVRGPQRLSAELPVVAGAIILAAISAWMGKKRLALPMPSRSDHYAHSAITDRRILLAHEEGPVRALGHGDIYNAAFDWDNGARVLRLSAKAPLNKAVLARRDIETAMRLVQERFLLGRGASS